MVVLIKWEKVEEDIGMAGTGHVGLTYVFHKQFSSLLFFFHKLSC